VRPIAAALPLISGATVFVTGMRVVMRGTTVVAPEERFALFHLGFGEASSGWFIGAALAAPMLAMIATWTTSRDEAILARPSARAITGAVVCAAIAVFAWEPGAIAISCAAIALLVTGAPARGPEAALSSAAAVAAIGLLAWVRLVSESARLWSSGLSRAARAIEIVRLEDAQAGVWIATAVGMIAIAIAGSWRGVRAWSRRRIAALALAASEVALALALPWYTSRGDRAALWGELASHFSVWNDLDPPRGPGEGPARIGPTLQLGRARIAVDGEDVAPIAALSGDANMGPLLVAQRLGPLLMLEGEGPELVLAADRSLGWHEVLRALTAAYDLGVRRLDIVLLRGASVRPDPRAPPEASMVLPSDLRAFEVELAEDGASFDPHTRFDRVARRLASREGRRIRIER
jgi:hypothetical protein